MTEDQAAGLRKPGVSRRAKIGLVVLVFLGGLVIAVLIAAQYAIRHAEPILRARVIQALSTRFNSQVQIDEFHVSVYKKDLDVEGNGLGLRSNLDSTLPPQISVGRFSFHAGLIDLFRSPMHVGSVEVHELVIKIPPKAQRAAMLKTKKGHSKLKIVIDRIICDDALLVIMTDDPKKIPLQFKIHALTLWRVGAHEPMHFQARLVNPKPIGDIASEGSFGPWNAEQPGDTPVDGHYSFTNADLSTTRGIAGTLSSTGTFSGKLDTITVDGTTDTPDFSIHVSGHKVDLRTQFHAIVNGTNGNTYLQPVHAQFLHTSLTATGYVVRSLVQKGHDIHLDVAIDRGRIEDLLQIGVKTGPPVMMGALQLKTSFELPAGKESVSRKLRLAGTFSTEDVSFNNPRIQKTVDEISLRTQGNARGATQLSRQDLSPEDRSHTVPATIHGRFALAAGTLALPQLVGTVPGMEVDLAGTYTLDGQILDFTGQARMDASVSSMVGGWKGALLKPMDRFFARNGASTEIPITITGTSSSTHFGFKLR